MSEDRKKTVFAQWGGSTATYFTYTHFSHDLCTGLLAPLLPLIKIGLGLSYLQSGILLSAFTVTSGLSHFPGGWIGDRFRRHVVIAIGLAGVSLFSMAVGLSPAYYPMLFILIIMGLFAGAYHPSAVSILSSHFEVNQRGKVIALHMVGGSIGYALGPVLGGVIAELMGWRYAFILLGIPALAAVPLILRKFRQPEMKTARRALRQDAGTKTGKHRKPSIFSVLKPVGIIFTTAILVQLIGGTAMAFIPLYLVDKHYIAPALAALLIGVTRGGGILGSIAGGWLSDRWGRKEVIFLGIVATGPVLLVLTRLSYNAGMVAVLILFGVFMYMRNATTQPYLMDNVPPEMRATIFGIYFGLSMEGMSFLQPVAGYLMDNFGVIAVFDWIAWASLALSAAALVLMKKVKPPQVP